MLWIMSGSNYSPDFLLPIILVQVDLSLICPKNVLPEMGWFLQVFFSKVNLSLSNFQTD